MFAVDKVPAGKHSTQKEGIWTNSYFSGASSIHPPYSNNKRGERIRLPSDTRCKAGHARPHRTYDMQTFPQKKFMQAPNSTPQTI